MMNALEIGYRNKTLEKECTDRKIAIQSHGTKMATKIFMRINELRAADSVESLIQNGIGRCHPLRGDRKGQFAMDLVQPHRIVFEKKENTIKMVEITSIEDYH